MLFSTLVLLCHCAVQAAINFHCESCAEEFVSNGGCVTFSDESNIIEASKYISKECAECASSFYQACEDTCNEVNIPGCDYKSCCGEQPLALCSTDECAVVYGYCCAIGETPEAEPNDIFLDTTVTTFDADCESCAFEFMENGGCEVFADSPDSLDPNSYVSQECHDRSECTELIYSTCEASCNDVNIIGCGYEACCGDDPFVSCYTEECLQVYGYCCQIEVIVEDRNEKLLLAPTSGVDYVSSHHNENHCDACDNDFVSNGGCAIYAYDHAGEVDPSDYLSEECSGCATTSYAACKSYCKAVYLPGCDYNTCCTDNPSALCFTMQCMQLFGYCCNIESGHEVYRRRPNVDMTPTENPAIWLPTPEPTPSVCVEVVEWTQERSDETCPGESHHQYGVELCDTYNNPDYRTRLERALANNLYSDCSNICLYDLDTYDSDTPHAFKWTGSCYNLNINAWHCFTTEEDAKETVYEYIPTLCSVDSTDTDCIERVAWSREVAEANCPDGFGSGGDKGYGTAKICKDNIRLEDGYYEYADVTYSASFNLTLANFIYWSCSATCMYDLVYPGVVYNWKSGEGCWAMQTQWSCITDHAEEYAWANEYIDEEICYEATPAPEPFECTERVQDWSQEIALETCGYDDVGSTDKHYNASVCSGYEDYQYRLGHSLANRMFLSCDAWCVYDIYTSAREAFIWRSDLGCYKPVTTGLCIEAESVKRQEMEDYTADILCESTSPEPTAAPTCTPQEEWSEDLMDQYCSVDDTASTYKHYESVGRAAVPCDGYTDYEDDLLKSLAQQMYLDCSSWCVYDYNSDAVLAWKWTSTDLCWDLKSWGSCHWDYTNGVNNAEWDDAKEIINNMCTYSPTKAPTSCIPYYTWDDDRSEDLCPSDVGYGDADKSYGAVVCTDSGSETKQQNLEYSLANHFFTDCASWCVYDYETVINNVVTDSTDNGGFIWKGCWKWVTGWSCFTNSYAEFEEVMLFAEGECAAQ